MDATVDWPRLRAAATEVMWRAYARYSGFPVGAAALVDDGRIVVGCNVENASYGITLCAECGVVSSLHATGGGRLVALSCVDGNGAPLMPCGRCRQLLWEHGGPRCMVDSADGPIPMFELLPHAFGPADLDAYDQSERAVQVPDRLRRWRGQGTVFVHPDVAGGRTGLDRVLGAVERLHRRPAGRAGHPRGGPDLAGGPHRRRLGPRPYRPGDRGRRRRRPVLGRYG